MSRVGSSVSRAGSSLPIVAIQPVWLGVRDLWSGAGGVRVEGLVSELS
jgi:hypothetical protein